MLWLSRNIFLIGVLQLCCLTRSVNADFPDCSKAIFPQLFGSKGSEADSTILGVDIHTRTNTVVAVGYSDDKELARDSKGGVDSNYDSWSRVAMVNVYPTGDPEAATGYLQPTFFTV